MKYTLDISNISIVCIFFSVCTQKIKWKFMRHLSNLIRHGCTSVASHFKRTWYMHWMLLFFIHFWNFETHRLSLLSDNGTYAQQAGHKWKQQWHNDNMLSTQLKVYRDSVVTRKMPLLLAKHLSKHLNLHFEILSWIKIENKTRCKMQCEFSINKVVKWITELIYNTWTNLSWTDIGLKRIAITVLKFVLHA